ncbi:MAG: GNAT family N-acetyltransferase [Pyrinomonadaceae bacterium]|nr:GNAT family N-acetyltransferase [Phycisphaerales bacterium]
MDSSLSQAPATVLRTSRLLLRPLQESDRAEFIRVQTSSTRHLSPWSPAMEPGQTFDELFSSMLARTLRGLSLESDYRFATFLHTGELVGMFNLNNVIRGVFQNAFAGWWLSVDSIGRGFGCEALPALLDHAFAEQPAGLGLHRVQANIIPANERSIRLAQRVGFRQEGLARGYLKIAGVWQDHMMFAKLAEEHQSRMQTTFQ